MFLTRLMTIALTFTLLCPAWTCADDVVPAEKPTYTLRYKFKQGEKIGYHIKSIDRNKMERGAFAESSQNRSDYRNHIEVLEVKDDGNAVLVVQIDQAIMETKFDDNPPIVFDSTDPEKQPAQFWQVKESIGKPSSKATVSTSGELIEIQNLRPDPKNPDRPVEPAKKDVSQNFLVRLPEKAVSIGDSWDEDYQITIDGGGMPLPLKMKRTFKLTKVEDHLATISMKSGVLSPINSPEVEARTIQQAPSCEIVFDMKAGQIVKRNWSVNKIVIGGFGPNTSFKVVSLREDTLVPAKLTDASQSTAKAN